jgi:hypothetical protein
MLRQRSCDASDPSYCWRIAGQNTTSVKSAKRYHYRRPPNDEPHHFLVKAAATLFETFFVNPSTALVFDPSVVTSIPLVIDGLTHAFEIISFGLDCPNCHNNCNPPGNLIQMPGSLRCFDPSQNRASVIDGIRALQYKINKTKFEINMKVISPATASVRAFVASW